MPYTVVTNEAGEPLGTEYVSEPGEAFSEEYEDYPGASTAALDAEDAEYERHEDPDQQCADDCLGCEDEGH